MESRDTNDVTFVIPAKDEAGAVGDVVKRALESQLAVEVLVVDDGSKDQTAAEAAAAGARVVSLPVNRGKGRALQAGVEAARPGIVVVLDADGQDDPREAKLLLEALSQGADLVIGSRFMGTLEPGAITPVNKAANLAITLGMRVLYGHAITDSQAGFRAFRRSTYLSLGMTARRYDVETEMLAKALRRGLKVVEVPVTRKPRAAGITKMNRFETGLRIARAMVRERFS